MIRTIQLRHPLTSLRCSTTSVETEVYPYEIELGNEQIQEDFPVEDVDELTPRTVSEKPEQGATQLT